MELVVLLFTKGLHREKCLFKAEIPHCEMHMCTYKKKADTPHPHTKHVF